MVSFARPGARSGLGSLPVSRRRFSGPLSSALLNTSTHVFFSNPTPVLQSAFIPVILRKTKNLSKFPPPCHPERSEGSFPPCLPRLWRRGSFVAVFLRMTKKRESVSQDDRAEGKAAPRRPKLVFPVFSGHQIWYRPEKWEKIRIFSLTAKRFLYYNTVCAIARQGVFMPIHVQLRPVPPQKGTGQAC